MEGRATPSANAPSATVAPERLLREASLLALILGLALALAAVERRGLIAWQGYPSSLALLAFGWWYKTRLAIRLRLSPPQARGRRWPIVLCLPLVAMLAVAAYAPLRPQAGPSPSPLDSLHLLLLVPVSEEFYFRGLLFDHLRRGFTAPHAVVLCSVLFALLHLPAGATVVAGVLSLLTCLLVLKTNALGAAIQVHVAWNAWTQLQWMSDPATRWTWALLATAVIVALGIGSLWGGKRGLTHDAA